MHITGGQEREAKYPKVWGNKGGLTAGFDLYLNGQHLARASVVLFILFHPHPLPEPAAVMIPISQTKKLGLRRHNFIRPKV